MSHENGRLYDLPEPLSDANPFNEPIIPALPDQTELVMGMYTKLQTIFEQNPCVEDPHILAITKAERATEKYDHEVEHEGLIFRVAQNAIRDQLRKPERRNTFEWPYGKYSGDSAIDFSMRFASPENIEETVVNREEIRQLLSELPPHFHEPLLLTLEGYSQKEIAEIMEIPVGTVKSQVSRAREAARKIRDKYEK
jgi:RNA polymerase sigma factor (sigma-70 family)